MSNFKKLKKCREKQKVFFAKLKKLGILEVREKKIK